MFERFTERARRVIFYSRYEASQFGSTSIETEHFLLGLLREDASLAARFTGNPSANKEIHDDIVAQLTVREKVSTSMDLPLSTECRGILRHSIEEAEWLNHTYIGIEHLFLGVLRVEQSLAARVLGQHGFELNAARAELATHPVSAEQPVSHFPQSSIGGKVLSLNDAAATIPTPDGKRFTELFKHGSLSVEIYAPKEIDPQTLHSRDEAYIVASGSGEFVFAHKRVRFSTGDFLFAPARVPHRFENFTDDLVVWVIFYGPEGGEWA
ncbi:MAG TPA: Clp protease N-terminal domain-containing protein [Terriglobia bacterium]